MLFAAYVKAGLKVRPLEDILKWEGEIMACVFPNAGFSSDFYNTSYFKPNSTHVNWHIWTLGVIIWHKNFPNKIQFQFPLIEIM